MIETIEKHYKEHKDEYLKHVREDILKLVEQAKKTGKRINKKDYNRKINSYEYNLMMPYFSDKRIIEDIEYNLKCAGREFWKSNKYDVNDTYNEMLKHKYIHILLDRFKEKVLEK